MGTKKKKSDENQLSFRVTIQTNKQETGDFQREDYWEYCDNCGHKLVSRKCELICPRCGFFHSCSEP